MSLVVVALASLLAATPQELAFTPAPLKEGQKVTVSSSSDATITVSVKLGGQEVQRMEMTPKQDVACVATVTAADEKGPSAAQLAFAKCTMTANTPLGAQTMELGCSSQTYEVKRGEAGFTATPEPDAEAKEMTSQICGSTLASPLASVLGGKTLKKGDVLELDKDDARKVLGLFTTEFDVKSVKLTLDGERKEGGVDAAVFKAEAKMTQPQSEQPSQEIAMDLAGELVVARSALILVAASLTGPVTMSGSIDQGGQEIEMAGTGTMNWKYAAAIE